ncbi:hypothetical protein BDD12DRAFT_865658 [Trichophaea hybrida]|nr:hypothetical protein BDD12DRAFT_865658 [Trichophaea hybrida]
MLPYLTIASSRHFSTAFHNSLSPFSLACYLSPIHYGDNFLVPRRAPSRNLQSSRSFVC